MKKEPITPEELTKFKLNIYNLSKGAPDLVVGTLAKLIVHNQDADFAEQRGNAMLDAMKPIVKKMYPGDVLQQIIEALNQ